MRFLKLAILVLVVLCLVNIASAYEVYNGILESTGSSQTTNSVSYVSTSESFIDCLGVKEGGLGQYLTSATLMMPYSAWAGDTSPSYQKGNITYKQDASEVGTGWVYYWIMDTTGDPTPDWVYLKFHIDDGLNLSDGEQLVTFEGTIASSLKKKKSNTVALDDGYNEKSVFIGLAGLSPDLYAVDGTHKAFHDITFYNTYSYWYNDIDLFTFYLNRDENNQSQLLINNGYLDLINETSLETDPVYVYSDDLTNHTWDVEVLDQVGITHELEINFISFIESEGTIEFNQTSYTDPEIIQVDIELTSYDFTNYRYYISIDTSTDLDTWHMASGNYNDTIEITSAEDSRTFDFLSEYYDLPIWIRAALKEYNLSSGEYTYVDYSPAEIYNPPTAYDYTVTGMVFDAYTFSPISGATVTAEGPIDTSATTTVAGRYTLYLAGGEYTLTANKTGYVDCVNEDIIIVTNISQYNFYLTSTSVTNGTINGIIRDADTDDALDDVHIIFTNDTDRIDLYSTSTGYYSGSGFTQSDTYDIRAIKSGYYAYNGSVTIAASGGTNKNFDMVQINYTATPTPTPTDTYPGGSGHAWTNDEIITMLRVLIPGIFLLMLIFLLMAVMTGFSGNGGNGGLSTLWRRY